MSFCLVVISYQLDMRASSAASSKLDARTLNLLNRLAENNQRRHSLAAPTGCTQVTRTSAGTALLNGTVTDQAKTQSRSQMMTPAQLAMAHLQQPSHRTAPLTGHAVGRHQPSAGSTSCSCRPSCAAANSPRVPPNMPAAAGPACSESGGSTAVALQE